MIKFVMKPEDIKVIKVKVKQGAVLLTVGRSYVGNDVTHSTLLDKACACSYENLPKYHSYRVSNTAPCFQTYHALYHYIKSTHIRNVNRPQLLVNYTIHTVCLQ